MQELIQSQKIMDDDRKQVILEILADKYCKLILHNTLEKPKSAMEISSEKKIPISTVYRRLQTLYDAKLLAISGSINQDGKKYFLYKSRVKSISLKCDLEVTSIELVPNTSRESQ
ncbi:MAG: ArsR family transcriptional regulator [Nitrosopumilus sp.]|nr:ArsR family transcriptional regulator [Nitrosopumilus sp.]